MRQNRFSFVAALVTLTLCGSVNAHTNVFPVGGGTVTYAGRDYYVLPDKVVLVAPLTTTQGIVLASGTRFGGLPFTTTTLVGKVSDIAITKDFAPGAILGLAFVVEPGTSVALPAGTELGKGTMIPSGLAPLPPIGTSSAPTLSAVTTSDLALQELMNRRTTATMQTQVGAIDTRVGSLEGKLASADAGLKRANEAHDRLNVLTPEVTRAHDRLDIHWTAIQGLRGDVGRIEGKVDRALEELKTLKDRPATAATATATATVNVTSPSTITTSFYSGPVERKYIGGNLCWRPVGSSANWYQY